MVRGARNTLLAMRLPSGDHAGRRVTKTMAMALQVPLYTVDDLARFPD